MAPNIQRYFRRTFAFVGVFLLIGIIVCRRNVVRHRRQVASRVGAITPVTIAIDATCKPNFVQNGVPWPDCISKILWMHEFWKTDLCYTEQGVNGSICSMITYLAEKEKVCPPTELMTDRDLPDFFNGEIAAPRTSLAPLIEDFRDMENMKWVSNRLNAMQGLWEESTRRIFSNELKDFTRRRKRIHLHMGLLSIGMGEQALEGGPLGELVQWSDLMASLYMMGHDIVITRSKRELLYVYSDYIVKSKHAKCQILSEENNFPFDIVYTDVIGYNVISSTVSLQAIKCRFRILDSFGTEAMFNAAPVSKANPYGGLGLDLRQVNTLFPHTPDNTFLGFVVENPVIRDYVAQKTAREETPRDIALVYGKSAEFWAHSQNYLGIVKEYVSEVHGTVAEEDVKTIPSYVVNHGVLPPSELFALLRRTKIFLGLGFPFEGPAPLEAIAAGAIFINPKFAKPISSETHEFYSNKPTRRSIFSQNPYSETHIGKPHVYTVDINNQEELRKALKEIQQIRTHSPYLPYEYSAEGMLERVSVLVEKQNTCKKSALSISNLEHAVLWPPLRSLKIVAAPDSSSSCEETCAGQGLRCEPSYFPIVNRPSAFQTSGIQCKSEEYPMIHRTDYPAYDEDGNCYFQTHDLYFSCAESQTRYIRLCPCRDFRQEQVALCENCVF